MQAALSSDATPYIISGLSACVAFMATILSTVLLAKLGGLTKKVEDLGKDIQALQLTAEGFRGFATTAHAKITSLESNTLTREVFDLRTDGQDAKLDAIKEKVTEIDRSKASRSDLKAVRPPLRKDGPTSDPPSDPPPLPPPRPRKPSIGRYGAE